MNRPWTNVSNFRTYITSGVVDYTWSEANDFCHSQHTAGLVTWDTEEKYRDIKFIVNPDGEGSPSSFTALYNENKIDCDYATGCDGQLVSIILSCDIIVLNLISHPAMETLRHGHWPIY